MIRRTTEVNYRTYNGWHGEKTRLRVPDVGKFEMALFVEPVVIAGVVALAFLLLVGFLVWRLTPTATTRPVRILLERPGALRDDVEAIDLSGEDAAVIIVLTGAVKLFRLHVDGRQTLLHVAGHGDLLNAEPVLTGHDTSDTRLAGTESQVLALPRSRFGTLHATNEEIRRALARTCAQRLQEQDERHGHIGHLIDDRVWAFLFTLARRHGSTSRDGLELGIGLTQTDIAAALGVSTSSVESAMRRLRHAGRLTTSYAWVTLHEPF